MEQVDEDGGSACRVTNAVSGGHEAGAVVSRGGTPHADVQVLRSSVGTSVFSVSDLLAVHLSAPREQGYVTVHCTREMFSGLPTASRPLGLPGAAGRGQETG